MEFKNILDSVTKLRLELQEKRKSRNYSRSISPQASENNTPSNKLMDKKSDNSEFFEEKISIPVSRQELVDKYCPWKCPLPRPKSKQKSYKIDAAELIVISTTKVFKKYFLELKQHAALQKLPQKNLAKPKPTRGKSSGEPMSDGLFFAKPTIRNEKKRYGSFFEKVRIQALERCLTAISTRSHRLTYKQIISISNSSNEKNPLLILNRLTLIHVKHFFNWLAKPVFTPRPKPTLLPTPKFLKNSIPTRIDSFTSFTPDKLSKSSQNTLSNTVLSSTPKPDLDFTPGKIVSLIKLNEFERKKLEDAARAERNPTFGDDSDLSPRVSIQEIKEKNSQRNSEIKRSIEELDRSNSYHQQLLNKSRQHSLGSLSSSMRKYNSDSIKPDRFSKKEQGFPLFFGKGLQKPGGKNEISPIKQLKWTNPEGSNLEDQWTHYENELISNYEELSLKSFNQNTHYSSFDKESSIVKNSKEESDSFESRFGNMLIHPESSAKTIRTPQRPRSFSQTLSSFQFLAATFAKFHTSSAFQLWKNLPLTKDSAQAKLKLTNLSELLKKKSFPVLWHAWKSMKHLTHFGRKLKHKLLLRRSIEAWESFSQHKSTRWIEAFYQWRVLIKQAKMYKLKTYKQLFS